MLQVLAPAKVNLSLLVGPPGVDGRHSLDSLVGFVQDCSDILNFEIADDISLAIDGPFAKGLSSSEDNLVMRAARLLRDFGGKHIGATIRLHKRLPVASGIGGGSADAAATLVGLNRLWAFGASTAQLQHLGSALGADVPACVLGTCSRMTGTGERIDAIPPLPKLGIVLVNPLVDCPTTPVYRRYDKIGSFSDIATETLPSLNTITMLLDYLRARPNDLTKAASDLVPKIGTILSAIGATQNVLLGRMSGSGATCFGLYANLADAQAGAHMLKDALAFSPIWVEAGQIS
jgi:4-diphosphocytidyl-2-C-methyl-D-erythritol kinase